MKKLTSIEAKNVLTKKLEEIDKGYQTIIDLFVARGKDKDVFEKYCRNKMCYYFADREEYCLRFHVNNNYRWVVVYGKTKEECIEKSLKLYTSGNINIPFLARSELFNQIKLIQETIKFLEKNFNAGYLYV